MATSLKQANPRCSEILANGTQCRQKMFLDPCSECDRQVCKKHMKNTFVGKEQKIFCATCWNNINSYVKELKNKD